MSNFKLDSVSIVSYILSALIYSLLVALVVYIPIFGFAMLAIFSAFSVWALGQMIKEIIASQKDLRKELEDKYKKG